MLYKRLSLFIVRDKLWASYQRPSPFKTTYHFAAADIVYEMSVDCVISDST